MRGQVGEVVWGAVSVRRATGATAWPVQSSKGSKSKGRAPPGGCEQLQVCSAGLRGPDGPAHGRLGLVLALRS